jgi:hypothetical protein
LHRGNGIVLWGFERHNRHLDSSQTPSPPQKEISATIQEAFRQAVALHQHGRFAEAEAVYQDILRQDPPSSKHCISWGLSLFKPVEHGKALS